METDNVKKLKRFRNARKRC